VKEIVVASKNAGKVAEFAAALAHLPVRVLALADFGDVPEALETGDTFAANAVLKAKHYAYHTGKACLADDSGLEVDALQGAPGVYSARFAGEHASDQDNNAKLLTELSSVRSEQQRIARFRCVLAFSDCDGMIITANGVCEGHILQEPRGAGGFGYDPLFALLESGRTLAELSLDEKNAISHRGQALRNMAANLVGYCK
jgi:XTP/dITP diphosphohydrolase